MISKKLLLVIYNSSFGNEQILNEDFNRFFKSLETDNPSFKEHQVQCRVLEASNPNLLYVSLRDYLEKDGYEEVFLHFSSHGLTQGLPFEDWILQNEDLATMVNKQNVKCCFFSACKSSELARLVAGKKVPVVIGTKADQNIQNGYAIKFQKKFYSNLAKKHTILEAFEQAVTELNTEQSNIQFAKDTIIRGEFTFDELKPQLNNEFQILFHNEADQAVRLIYPTIFDELELLEKQGKQILLVYSSNEQSLRNFEKTFRTKGYLEFFKLFPILEKNLTQESINKFRALITIELKIAFIADKEDPLFSKPTSLSLFNEETIFEYDNLKFALLQREGVGENAPLKNAEIFKDSLNRGCFERLYYENLNKIFEKPSIENFLNELPSTFQDRKDFLLNLPCPPTKNEIYELDTDSLDIRIFFAPKSNERLVYFLINWLKKTYALPPHPNIICDNLHKEDQIITDLVMSSVGDTYKNHNEFQKLITNKNFKALAYELFKHEGHVIVVRIHKKSLLEIADEVQQFITDFDQGPSFFNVRIQEHPTFIFFILEDSYATVEQFNKNLKISKTKQFSTPEPFTTDLFNSEVQSLRNKNRSLFKLLEDVVIDFEKFAHYCPSIALGHISSEILKIPQRQIINIS